jgi:hypothetical protein
MNILPRQDFSRFPSYSKILLHCLYRVSLEKSHPSLLETGPSSPNQKKESMQVVYTAGTIFGGDATKGTPTTLTRLMIWLTC